MTVKIIIDGADGSGKTTQVELLKKDLEKAGYTCEAKKLPNVKGKIGSMIYSMLKTGTAVTRPNLFHFLHIVEKVLFQRENFVHKPGIDFMILDRWKTSGLIYAKCGKVHPLILKLADLLIKPGDIEIILHSDKSLREESRDFFEKEEFQNKIRKEYVSLKYRAKTHT